MGLVQVRVWGVDEKEGAISGGGERNKVMCVAFLDGRVVDKRSRERENPRLW